jgi:hypothetical protein
MKIHKVKVLMKPGKSTIGPVNYGIAISKDEVIKHNLLNKHFEELHIGKDFIILKRIY